LLSVKQIALHVSPLANTAIKAVLKKKAESYARTNCRAQALDGPLLDKAWPEIIRQLA